eukprot:CAMPEP_0201518388 /NCGR_PEP_ID=MMETSP0161_2-20130828/9249_1 /ASSEMBLY_ACC=CAM_ASM_000251 /TAXON_ID=180227 /ORGANISM="Neoparamoeba aestuarina, Strain SoJaBio B1-5/56/2" /LENGTH=408 /DNA_ID=CAMNT_0047916153 /DNA_START=45 /DNA_END=1271 /DNA_ORIENTATION=-
MARKILSPLASLGLEHRIVMAPLTRLRGDKDTLAPGPDVVTYYTQRASKGGLLITEASPISPETPYETACGIFTPQQEAGWSKVCDAIHKKGAKISLQLWHLGRLSHKIWGTHPLLSSLGRPLGSVSSSEVETKGHARDWEGNIVQYTTPRALTEEELEKRLPNDYKLAAEAAKRAGFDFVEVHAAHGYLMDQFFCDSVNKRTDKFGAQNFENRTRLFRSVLKQVIDVMGEGRVGVRLSPTYKDSINYYSTTDSNSEKLYREIVEHLNNYPLAYLLLSEPRWNGGKKNTHPATDPTYALPLRNTWARDIYKGTLIGCSSFTPETAEKAIQEGHYDAVAFGRFFISNPNLKEKIEKKEKLTVFNTSTFYTRGDKGYIDYPGAEGESGEKWGNYEVISWEDIGKKKKAKL